MAFDAFVAPDDGLAAGARTLHGLICDHVDQLNQPTGLGSIIDVIKLEPSRILGFNYLNKEGAVEAHMTFWAYKNDRLLWMLKVAWDTDNPLVESTQKPHYRWEICFNNGRVAGLGHAWFQPKTHLPYWKLKGVEIKEEQTGVHLEQFSIGSRRIDRTMRLFKGWRPGEDDARNEFNPQALNKFHRSSFGRQIEK